MSTRNMFSKFFNFLFLLIVVIATSLAAESEETRKCVPGKRYNDRCNYYTCSNTKVDFCTMKECYNTNPVTSILETMELLPAPPDF
ncbi:hypothetical protein QLX08_004354 [Tetragonisca angustula]|uniref:Uncharacterized protein n=1 Tax=Tetragonisca angustula TaxID=166442 RepID=A0AAW1A2D3_9HYME